MSAWAAAGWLSDKRLSERGRRILRKNGQPIRLAMVAKGLARRPVKDRRLPIAVLLYYALRAYTVVAGL
jgi:hypothetical protein